MPPAGAFMVQSSRSKSNNDNNNRRHASNESKEENPPFREHKVTLLSAIASASVSSPPTAAAQNDDDNNLLLHLGVPGGDSDKRQTVSSSSAAAIPLELPFLSLEDDKSTIRDEKKLDGDPPSHHLWRHHLANNLYHRDKEVATIVSCYHQSLTAAAEGKPNTPASFLLVSGTMGTGKTRLVHDALAHLVRDKGGYFLVGKHDQLRRPEPYSGLVSAFAEFASQVVDRGSDEVNALRSVICQAVGEEFSVLISMFPALAQIFGDKTDCVMNNAKSTDGIQRFIFVFQLFLQTISSLDRPIVLVLDDLHWTDPCSIDTFCSILSDLKSIPGLFVIGTYDDKLASDVLKRKLSELEHSRIETTRIALQSLDQGEVNHVVGNALQLSRLDLVEDLGRMVHNQAGGNFFYIIEFFQWLQDSELVSFQVETNTWDWDSSEIQMTLDQCHQGHFSTDTFKRLSTDMIEILKVAACLGFQLNQSHVEFVVDRPVSSFLETAVSLHILVVDSGTGNYSFKHDGTQKAVYELIPENGRELFHLEVGRRLWRRLSKDDLEKNIFVVLSQIHIGKRLITREKERYAISSLCLHAGRKAAKSSTFRTATIYLNLAIELLGDRGWYDDYDLTLALYNAAAEMNMCTGSFDSMEANIECVLEKSRNSGDQIQAQSTKIYAMGMMDRQHEAIDLGIQVLASLGVRFPYMKCRRAMKSELCSVQKLVKGKSNEQLMRLPIIEDRTILSGLHILNMIYLNSMLVRPELTPFIALRMMRLTLAHGLSMIAPAAFVTYGILCISCNYDGDSALRFGNLSIELLERLEVKEYLPRVYAGMYSCIVPWKRPLRESLPPLLLANRVGMQTGDVEFSSMSANLYCFSAIDAGVPIDEIERVWTSFQQTMRTNRQKVLLNLSIPCMESIQFYRDDTVGMTKTESLLQHCIENKLHHTANQIRMSQMRTAYIFNDFDRADRLGRQSMKELWSMPPTFEVVSMSFYNGMAALAMAGNRKRVLSSLRRAKFVITILDCIARSCPANGLDKKFLLKAELAKVRFRDEEAFEMYCCAIALANHNRFLHIEAMANERCGRFFLDREKKSDAAPYFRKAIALYGQWGAQAKVKRLNLEMDSLYDGSF